MFTRVGVSSTEGSPSKFDLFTIQEVLDLADHYALAKP